MKIPLSSPDITDLEINLVNRVLHSRFLSIGPMVEEFEREMAAYAGARYAVAVNSGTSGLHLLVRAMGIREGDEVITTPFSFVSSTNCFLFERARPVFVDIDPDTLCIDVNKIEEKITSRTRAILSVDVFGHPAAMDEIKTIADRHRLNWIDDACEAIGAEYRGRRLGSFGDAAVFAFYPNKQMTTGEGGIIVTDSEEIYRTCRSLRNQGRGEGDDWLAHDRLGYNYRLDEMSAALGVGQLQRIDELLVKREQAARAYRRLLEKIPGVRTPYVSPDVRQSWFVYVIRLEKRINRQKVMQHMLARGIQCRPYFPPIHLQPYIAELTGSLEGMFPVTEEVAKSTLALPFFGNIDAESIQYVCSTLADAISRTEDEE